jgi:hypothetical protein
MDMEHETLISRSGDTVADDGFVDPVGRSWPRDNVESLSGSTRTQALEYSPHPAPTEMSRQPHDRKALKLNLRTAIAVRDSHDPKDDRDSWLCVATAHRHPEITHAHATSCGMYTCAHRRCRLWT